MTKEFVQVYVVAGGDDQGSALLRSTEIFYFGAQAWKWGEDLPRNHLYGGSASLDHSVLFFGWNLLKITSFIIFHKIFFRWVQ